MDTPKISFTGIIPLKRQSPKCAEAINKIADICFDKNMSFDSVKIGDIEYVFTGNDVEKNLDNYLEISELNKCYKEACMDFLTRLQKVLTNIKPEDIKKVEKPSVVEELMRPNPYSQMVDEAAVSPKAATEKMLEGACINLSFKTNESKIKSNLEELVDDKLIETSLTGLIKDGHLSEYLNEACADLSFIQHNLKTNFNSLSKSLQTKHLLPLEPEEILQSIANKTFNVRKGRFETPDTHSRSIK